MALTKLRYKLLTADRPMFVIAGLSGVHPTLLSQYSRSLKPISSAHMILLCNYFNCEPEDLLGEIDPEEIKRYFRERDGEES